MKLTCDRSALVDKLAILARGVSTRSALPVLSGIMLQAQDGLVAAKETLAQAHFEVAVADLALRRAVGTFPGL